MTYTKPEDHVRAVLAAEKLNTAGRRYGFTACEHKLAGAFYVVITRGSEWDRAYKVSDVDIHAVTAKDWDYLAWHAAIKPEEDPEVAVCYFMTFRRDLSREDGQTVLRAGPRAALALRAGGEPCGLLTEPQREVLKIAEKWGWGE